MKSNYKIAAAIVGSFALGVGTAGVFAQSTAPYYEVAEINVKDKANYEKTVGKARDAIKTNGGKIIAGGYDKATSVMGAPPPSRFLITQYPNKEAADKAWAGGIKEWADTDGRKYADLRVVGVEGIEQK